MAKGFGAVVRDGVGIGGAIALRFGGAVVAARRVGVLRHGDCFGGELIWLVGFAGLLV